MVHLKKPHVIPRWIAHSCKLASATTFYLENVREIMLVLGSFSSDGFESTEIYTNSHYDQAEWENGRTNADLHLESR